MSFMTLDADGNRFWRDATMRLHRDRGPAAIYHDGMLMWYQAGLVHRDDGPAITHKLDKRESWLRGGFYHRWDGPAIIHPHLQEFWFIHGHDVTDEVRAHMKQGYLDPSWRLWNDDSLVMMRLLFSCHEFPKVA